MLTIHDRPFPPEDRSEPGHWEGDLIIGKDQGSAIGTLVERRTRLVRLLHLPNRDGEALHDALKARMTDLPLTLLRSITWDQGTEMARHLTITRTLGVPVYFCDSHSPWQRGSNENMNGLLRDYFPKSIDLRTYTAQHLLAVENELNNRPKRVLNDRSPAELYEALLASANQSMLRLEPKRASPGPLFDERRYVIRPTGGARPQHTALIPACCGAAACRAVRRRASDRIPIIRCLPMTR
jgi:transposase, IS30 family